MRKRIQTITRKDGVTYERARKEQILTRRYTLYMEQEMYDDLEEYFENNKEEHDFIGVADVVRLAIDELLYKID